MKKIKGKNLKLLLQREKKLFSHQLKRRKSKNKLNKKLFSIFVVEYLPKLTKIILETRYPVVKFVAKKIMK